MASLRGRRCDPHLLRTDRLSPTRRVTFFSLAHPSDLPGPGVSGGPGFAGVRGARPPRVGSVPTDEPLRAGARCAPRSARSLPERPGPPQRERRREWMVAWFLLSGATTWRPGFCASCPQLVSGDSRCPRASSGCTPLCGGLVGLARAQQRRHLVGVKGGPGSPGTPVPPASDSSAPAPAALRRRGSELGVGSPGLLLNCDSRSRPSSRFAAATIVLSTLHVLLAGFLCLGDPAHGRVRPPCRWPG